MQKMGTKNSYDKKENQEEKKRAYKRKEHTSYIQLRHKLKKLKEALGHVKLTRNVNATIMSW